MDVEAIRAQLSSSVREDLFRAIVDCVVFNTKTGYEPKFFIKLDSHFHNDGSAKENDRMKNSIVNAANVKLIRIRAHHANDIRVQRFKQLLLENSLPG